MRQVVICGVLLGAFLGMASWLGNTGATHAHAVSVFPGLLVLGAFPVFLYPLLRGLRTGGLRSFLRLLGSGAAASAIAGAVLNLGVAPLLLRSHLGVLPTLDLLLLTLCSSAAFGAITSAVIGLVFACRNADPAPTTGSPGA